MFDKVKGLFHSEKKEKKEKAGEWLLLPSDYAPSVLTPYLALTVKTEDKPVEESSAPIAESSEAAPVISETAEADAPAPVPQVIEPIPAPVDEVSFRGSSVLKTSAEADL